VVPVMVGGAWAGLTRWRFGVKVRAEFDRVSGLALMPIRRLVDGVRRFSHLHFGVAIKTVRQLPRRAAGPSPIHPCHPS
jgi:hypothetical protein